MVGRVNSCHRCTFPFFLIIKMLGSVQILNLQNLSQNYFRSSVGVNSTQALSVPDRRNPGGEHITYQYITIECRV